MTELVSVVPEDLPSDMLWRPEVGPELSAFLERSKLGVPAKQQLRERAVAVLGACVPPGATSRSVRTGLVVGHVQSGKTQSFTSLMALARDAGYPLVILLAGTKINLLDQTATRLRSDLQTAESTNNWLIVENPRVKHSKYSQVERVLAAATGARQRSARFAPRTVVLTVMKNAAQLTALARVLRELDADGALAPGTPILIIDDEADQAGLNARPGKVATPTYAAIAEVREAAGVHSYVMYTATPQAPLLLALTDQLSPDFVRVLTPGLNYTGGEHFFGAARSDFVRHISPDEVAAVSATPLGELPALEAAIACFLLGVVAEGTSETRSMLVHPSSSTAPHGALRDWIAGRLKGIGSSIRAGGASRAEVIEMFFAKAYSDLSTTVLDLPPLDDLIDEVAELARETDVRTVNSNDGEDASIDWRNAAAWILVGGYKLDRGFTIVGLTVTYMPRGAGVGNADAIQQRARFFGYKADYADYCRGWFEQKLEAAYIAYVDHEHHLLEELRSVEAEGRTLKQWKRRMLLDPALKPCRSSVVSLPHVRQAIRGDGWLQLAEIRPESFATNAAIVAALPWAESRRHSSDTRPGVPDATSHRTLRVSARDAIEHLLGQWSAIGVEAATIYQVAIVLANLCDANQDELVELVRMDAGEVRRRALAVSTARFQNLHVGKSKDYEGDRAIRGHDVLSLQFHHVVDSSAGGDPTLALALWVPARFTSGMLVEVDE